MQDCMCCDEEIKNTDENINHCDGHDNCKACVENLKPNEELKETISILECALCNVNLENTDETISPCDDHVFCKPCVKRLRQNETDEELKKYTCPFCRAKSAAFEFNFSAYCLQCNVELKDTDEKISVCDEHIYCKSCVEKFEKNETDKIICPICTFIHNYYSRQNFPFKYL
ncbi:uncharacterized protein LOC126894898 isoform X2 [Daktulosphaira vitifoliae]|uniref:uncharacterized protein LOC126894898 isoform X2 n=1 Tax=Daktulosphaira vitifoliae TaxID=58002 RepID=UPI0021AA5D10|nr:uncharacterized protein LOC126894898 isoform X2 [Daktulosphaira vitifoliae]